MGMTRRQFLHTAGVLALAPVVGESKEAPLNLFDALKPFHFLNEKGEPVNIAALKESLKNQYTTLSFGFASCPDMCPLHVNPTLSAIGSLNKDGLTSIVVNVAPEAEADKNFYAKMLRRSLPQKLIMLYPANENDEPSDRQAIEVEKACEQIVHAKNASKHSNYIQLFAPGGDKIAEKDSKKGADAFLRDWKDKFGETRGR